MDPEASTLDELRQEAFDGIGRLAEEFATNGRLCVAATAKLQLKTRLPTFDEATLQYRSFRAFLTDAEQHGAIELHPRGPDVEVVPPGWPPSAERIRRDLWKAIVDASTGKRYFYDRAQDRVLTDGDIDHSEDGSFVEMPTVPPDIQESWIADFVGTLPQAERASLALRIATAATLADKLRQLTADPEVRGRWYPHRMRRVLATLRDWSQQHQLDIPLTEPAPFGARPALASSTRTEKAERVGSAYENRVRERVRHAVERMPLADLLRLPIAVEHLIGD